MNVQEVLNIAKARKLKNKELVKKILVNVHKKIKYYATLKKESCVYTVPPIVDEFPVYDFENTITDIFKILTSNAVANGLTVTFAILALAGVTATPFGPVVVGVLAGIAFTSVAIKVGTDMMQARSLRHLEKENNLLEHVSSDYEKYYEFILSEKQAQLEAMKRIKQSLEDLIISGKLTDTDLENTRMEQRGIIKEMKSIREKLNTFVNKK